MKETLWGFVVLFKGATQSWKELYNHKMSVAEYNIHMEGIQFIYFFYRNISLNNYEGNNYITFLFFFSTKPVFEMKLPKL